MQIEPEKTSKKKNQKSKKSKKNEVKDCEAKRESNETINPTTN